MEGQSSRRLRTLDPNGPLEAWLLMRTQAR